MDNLRQYTELEASIRLSSATCDGVSSMEPRPPGYGTYIVKRVPPHSVATIIPAHSLREKVLSGTEEGLCISSGKVLSKSKKERQEFPVRWPLHPRYLDVQCHRV